MAACFGSVSSYSSIFGTYIISLHIFTCFVHTIKNETGDFLAIRIGKNTIELTSKPSIIGYGSAVGKKEFEGPLGKCFDKVFTDEFCGEKSFEKAETHLQKTAISEAIRKSPITKTDINIAFAGDLLNQCIGSSFGMRDLKFNFAGLYGACSTMALSLALGSLMVECGAASNALCSTSSHFCSAERQYRMPLEYGGQRSQAAQWTVTGSGAAIIGTHAESNPYIDKIIFGAVRDLGITDPNNMGAAMAPEDDRIGTYRNGVCMVFSTSF